MILFRNFRERLKLLEYENEILKRKLQDLEKHNNIMKLKEIIEAFENLRFFESTDEIEWGKVLADADIAIKTLRELKNNNELL